jgi:arylsulfatase A-like enzyme
MYSSFWKGFTTMNRMFSKIPRMTAVAVAIALAAALLFVPSCKKSTRSPNIILITLDTQRADHLSCYDPSHSGTPNLDALAESGLLFENCYSLIPITLPSHASIFYSRQPHELHVYNNGETLKEQSRSPSAVEILRKWGYKTAAVVSMGVLEASYGLDRGFEEYFGSFPHNGRFYSTAEEVNSTAFPWLEQNRDKNFFLWLHYSDPHAPYHPPTLQSGVTIFLNGGMLGDYALNETVYSVELDLTRVILTFQPSHALLAEQRRMLYREEVEYMDGQLGRLFEKIADLGLDAKTHILVVGDHGEGLGEYLRHLDRPHFGHIRYLYDVYMRVPLLIRAAGSKAREGRIKAPVSLLDIAPTLLSLADIRPVRQYQGVDLLAREILAPRDIIQATYKPEAEKNRFAILDYPMHLLFLPEDQTYELFDLESDPDEKTNIYPQKSGDESVRQLRLRLNAATRDIIKNRPAFKVDDRTEDMLRALGYIK